MAVLHAPQSRAVLYVTRYELVEQLVCAGDLSDYNILVHDKKPWFIDVAQAVVVDSVSMGHYPARSAYWYEDCGTVRRCKHGVDPWMVHSRDASTGLTPGWCITEMQARG